MTYIRLTGIYPECIIFIDKDSIVALSENRTSEKSKGSIIYVSGHEFMVREELNEILRDLQ